MRRQHVVRLTFVVGTALLLNLSGCSDEKKELAKDPQSNAPAATEAPPSAAVPIDSTTVTSEHTPESPSAEIHAQTGTAHWFYEGELHPGNWGALSPEFAVCSGGSNQSPIDISYIQFTNMAPLDVRYQDAPLQVVNNGHTIQVNYPAGSTLTIGDIQYELVQFHFHSPSEHTLGGHAFDMVVHLVHRNTEGGLAVIAAMLKEGKENELVKAIWENAPGPNSPGQNTAVTINAGALLPDSLSRYFHYSGSLTTPPCTENVQWFVLANPLEVSREQITKFRETFPLSTRPVQPINGRAVLAAN